MSADPYRELVKALARQVGPLEDLVAKSRDWSSVMYTGMQHELRFRVADDAATRGVLAALAEAELPMSGHFVADLRLVSAIAMDGDLDVVLEALTIAEA